MALSVQINGQPHELAEGVTLAIALATLGIQPATGGVAVAVDGAVVPRSEWPQCSLRGGEEVEIVRAVQGG